MQKRTYAPQDVFPLYTYLLLWPNRRVEEKNRQISNSSTMNYELTKKAHTRTRDDLDHELER